MQAKSSLALVAIAAVVGLAFSYAPDGEWIVRLRGAGPVAYGMTVPEAVRQSSDSLRTVHVGARDSARCRVLVPNKMAGLRLVSQGGEIVRTDVERPGVRTLSGVGVGSSVQALRRAYGTQVHMEPRPGGEAGDHYVVYVPRDRFDRDFRVVFETTDGRVTAYRSGLLSSIKSDVGCP